MLVDIVDIEKLSRDVKNLTFELFETLKPLMEDKSGVSHLVDVDGILGRIHNNLSIARSYLQITKDRVKEL